MRRIVITAVFLIGAGLWAQTDTTAQQPTAPAQTPTTQQQMQQRHQQRMQEQRADMQAMRQERMAKREQHVKEMQDQLAKMKTQVDAMRASAEKVKDQAAKQALITNADMWQQMLDHMKSMIDRIQQMGPGASGQQRRMQKMPAPPPTEAPQTVPKQ